jgi:protein-disulfide isomerase
MDPNHVRKGKREKIRQKRRQDHRRQLAWIYGGIAIAILIMAGLAIFPKIKPIGEIKMPDQLPRPEVSGNSTGRPDAPVKVEEFADFQCPACGQFSSSTEPLLIKQYIATGKVYYTFYPYSFIGKESFAAAEAAYCALDQNKFWEFHDTLFINQTGENVGDFSDRRLQAFAGNIGLDLKQFNSCTKNGTNKTKVQDDIRYGKKFGVNATPSFVVNGKLVTSGQLFETIESALALLQS